MPINTDLNVSPYFDDFDETKNFHRVLFRPRTAVQARELTQLQSILQNQIERFGNWAFKNGDIVSGCAIIDIPVMPFTRLEDFQSNNDNYDLESLIGSRVISANTNLEAIVIAVKAGKKSYYPNTNPEFDANKVYLKYINSGDNEVYTFSNTDQLVFYSLPSSGNATIDTIASINVLSNSSANTFASGNAHGISVTDGIVYLNGNFVRVEDSTVGIVNSYGTDAANNLVGFQALETIVTENTDTSLVDNALGYPNENAPGAHRLKITPVLLSLDSNTAANTEGFNPIASYNFNTIVMKTAPGISSIVEETISKRTYEESGNYVVNPFIVDTVSSVGTQYSEYGSANGIYARINPGVAYATGHRVELTDTKYVDIRRGVDTQVNKNQQISFNYGNFFVIKEVAGTFDFDSAQTVALYDSPQTAVTNRNFSAINPIGNQIGTASVRCFTYLNGVPGSFSCRYALHIFNIKLTGGYKVTDIRSVYYNSGIKAVADIDETNLIAEGIPIYSLGVVGVKNLRDEDNNNNTEYTYRKKQTGTMDITGNVTITLSASATGGIDILPFGSGVLTDLNSARFNLIARANTDTNALTGNVSVYTTNSHITGNGTLFTSNFIVGDQIRVGSDVRTVATISSDVGMDVDYPFSSSASGQSYYKRYQVGKLIPVSQSINDSFINVTNSTSFTISTDVPSANLSSSMSVDVIFDVLRTQTSPAKKVIRKNRFVRIDTSSNPNGPWCLGFGDVHRIRKVYSDSSGVFANSTSLNSTDITAYFTFDSGQRDSYYDYGYLYPVPGYNTRSNPYLLVQLDYFAVNSTPGVGFFTVESYPVDDANTANTSAIRTKDIPVYTTSSGRRLLLKDCIDFRTPVTPSANDTGTIDTSNNSQLYDAIQYSTLTPSSNLTFNVPASGLHVPSYGQTLQADYTFYLSRRDLVYITPDSIVKIKEGAAAINPTDPYCPDNCMAIATLEIPPFPSLTSEQIEENFSINKTSTNIVRDTLLSINARINTNRRWTMSDIGNLEKRITKLEYYAQLSLLEKKATDATITDAFGLDRFKNGIFVETFADYTTCEVSSPEFKIAIDRDKGVARPAINREIVPIEFTNATSTAVKSGRVISLPYTEVTVGNLVQPYATKFRSAALVAFAWNGKLILVPAFDNHKNTQAAGAINITIDTASPWQQFAGSAFSTIWGEWRTTKETTTNARSTVNLYLGGASASHDEAGNKKIASEIWTYLNRAGYNQEEFTIGNVAVNWLGVPEGSTEEQKRLIQEREELLLDSVGGRKTLISVGLTSTLLQQSANADVRNWRIAFLEDLQKAEGWARSIDPTLPPS